MKNDKKKATDQLLKELEDNTKKKAITIKERVEKKLVNLSIEQIRSFMLAKKDISFNQQNRLNVTNMNKVNHKSVFDDDDVFNLNTPDKNEGVEIKKKDEGIETKKITANIVDKNIFDHKLKKI